MMNYIDAYPQFPEDVQTILGDFLQAQSFKQTFADEETVSYQKSILALHIFISDYRVSFAVENLQTKLYVPNVLLDEYFKLTDAERAQIESPYKPELERINSLTEREKRVLEIRLIKETLAYKYAHLLQPDFSWEADYRAWEKRYAESESLPENNQMSSVNPLDREVLNVINTFYKQGSVGFPSIDRAMALKYDVEFCNQNQLIGAGLRERLAQLVEEGLVYRTQPNNGYMLTDKGLAALS